MTGRQPAKPRAAVRRDGSFDAFGMAARGSRIAGRSTRRAAARGVADRLGGSGDPDDGDVIAWRIAGTTDASGRPALEVQPRRRGAARVPALPAAVRVAGRASDVAAAGARRARARAVSTRTTRTRSSSPPRRSIRVALVEDELLLTLPFAPHCERARLRDGSDRRTRAARLAASARRSARLAALKGDPATKAEG